KPGGRARSSRWAELPAHVHEREAEEVGPAPALRIAGLGVVLAETDAPDRVEGARLDEDLLAGAAEERAELPMLGELRDVPVHHDADAGLLPALDLEAPHLAAEALRLSRIVAREDL